MTNDPTSEAQARAERLARLAAERAGRLEARLARAEAAYPGAWPPPGEYERDLTARLDWEEQDQADQAAAVRRLAEVGLG